MLVGVGTPSCFRLVDFRTSSTRSRASLRSNNVCSPSGRLTFGVWETLTSHLSPLTSHFPLPTSHFPLPPARLSRDKREAPSEPGRLLTGGPLLPYAFDVSVTSGNLPTPMPKYTDLNKILLIGSGPIVIGQGCEFDYSGVQACKALKEEGYEVVLVNSNPATIMTDPEFADRTYIEPITPEVIEAILEREKPDAILPTMGGQTALNVAMELNRNGALARHNVKLIGANAQAIAKGEDRQLFKEAMLRIGLDVPRSGIAHSIADAGHVADMIDKFPLIIR